MRYWKNSFVKEAIYRTKIVFIISLFCLPAACASGRPAVKRPPPPVPAPQAKRTIIVERPDMDKLKEFKLNILTENEGICTEDKKLQNFINELAVIAHVAVFKFYRGDFA